MHADLEPNFADVLERRAVRAIFQPIVDLDSAEVVAYEALARGPAGSPLAHPSALFAEAYRTGRVAELDWVCRAAAFRAALAAQLPPSLPLFVNAEPTTLGSTCPADLVDTVADAMARLRVVVEVTERSLANKIIALLAGVWHLRKDAVGVALDDVGANPASLTMMPLVRPDVIKLDLSLVQGWPSIRRARIINAVLAESERTGAVIVAEGIESSRHATMARAMGATLGQGWFFARPGPLPHCPPAPPRPPSLPERPALPDESPFEILARHRRARPAAKHLLVGMSRQLEYEGLDSPEPAVFLACFQHADNFGAAARQRYATFASQAVLAVALGRDMPPRPAPGVHGGPLAPADPLNQQWVVIVIGSHFAAALVALDLGDRGPDAQRRFEYVISHDRDLVIEAAQPLLLRFDPLTRDRWRKP